MTGKLYGLGVGPGDPELLTLKAHRLIREADVIAYPAPDTGPSFARQIAAQYISDQQIEVPIVVPMRVQRFPAQDVYDHAALEISAHLNAGRNVAVLCEGDPFFYGSFMYLFERLASDHHCEVVPGVSSVMASAAAVPQPLAARNDVLTILPGPLPDDQLIAHLERADAVAMIKIGRHFSRLKELLTRQGLAETSVYLERVTLSNQRISPLLAVEDDAAPYFSMILIYKGAEAWISALPVTASGERI